MEVSFSESEADLRTLGDPEVPVEANSPPLHAGTSSSIQSPTSNV